MKHLLNDHQDCLNQHENGINYAMKWASTFEFDEKSMATETTAWSKFPNEGKVIAD